MRRFSTIPNLLYVCCTVDFWKINADVHLNTSYCCERKMGMEVSCSIYKARVPHEGHVKNLKEPTLCTASVPRKTAGDSEPVVARSEPQLLLSGLLTSRLTWRHGND